MSWVQFTQANIARSQRERELSEKLRGEINALLQSCANSMWGQFNTVNNAFGARIQQAYDAKSKLQGHLNKVTNIFNVAIERINLQMSSLLVGY